MTSGTRRPTALALEIAPENDAEAALVDLLAAAFRRLEKADHVETQLLDGAFHIGDVPPGMLLYRQADCRRTLAVLDRYRASAAGEMIQTLRLLEGLREARRRGRGGWRAKRSLGGRFASARRGLRYGVRGARGRGRPGAGGQDRSGTSVVSFRVSIDRLEVTLKRSMRSISRL
jgi:hypothetical protein